ncbi:MAG: hypothetical protein WDO16_01205 [Bacteroidota bacterium]
MPGGTSPREEAEIGRLVPPEIQTTTVCRSSPNTTTWLLKAEATL